MRKAAGVGLLVVAVAGGCGSEAPTAEQTQPESLPAATTSSSTATTLAPVPLESPSAAATHLQQAWRAGDRREASRGASAEAVDALFARPFSAGSLRGCDAPGQLGSDCIFRISDGVLRMHTETRPEGGGYWVTRVEFAPA